MLDLHRYMDFILSNSILKSLSLVIASIVSAKIVDMVFTFIFKRLVSSTKTTLDDRILQLLHKPIFYSILFVGFILSIKTKNRNRPFWNLFHFLELGYQHKRDFGICRGFGCCSWFSSKGYGL